MLSILFTVVAPLVIVALISIPLIPVLLGKVSVKNAKYRVVLQICLFCAVFLGVAVFNIGGHFIHAEEAVASGITGTLAQGVGFIAAAIAVGCSAVGAAYAVAASAPAAIGAISENPDNFGKAMIFVALAEGCAIYGLLIAILIINKL
ncbi:MAG: ATP synthase subunit C [Erysipelotrichaceae bacterium]|nr:ATP synthase subunit C [Erysipelotrichaceae bacterium]